MKNLFKTLLILTLAITTVFALASCDVLNEILANIPGMSTGDTNDGGEDEGDGNEDDGNKVELEGLVLIEGGKAKFQIVQATQKGAPVRAKSFADKLRSLGVEVESPVGDSDASKVAEYEIIFGADIRNRPDCVVDSKYLGEDGYQIKVVGNKVIIAGGSDKSLSKACDIFTTQMLKITSKTKEGDIDNLAIPYDTAALKLHEYMITSLTVAGTPLSEYTLVYDVDAVKSEYTLEYINDFRAALYSETGYWLEVGEVSKMDTYEHQFIVRYTDEKLTNDDGQGFVAYVDANGDFIAEGNYKNTIDKAFEYIAEEYFFKAMGEVKIAKNFKKTVRTAIVRYSDFGAIGNGKADDFDAIYAAHAFANQGGQKVEGTEGAVYYIGDAFIKTIEVKTNVDFCGAKFIVNDKGDIAYSKRDIGLFTVARDHAEKVYNETQIDNIFGKETTIKRDDTKIEWIVPALEGDTLIRATNSKHKDFVRHGSNQNNGTNRQEVYLLDKDGNLNADTYVYFEFDDLTRLEIWRTDDAPITIENGEFENLCCEAVAATKFICVYKSYIRGFKIYRSNVTIQNVKHTMKQEPTLNVHDADGKDKMGTLKDNYAKYGTRDESYPYYGFFYIYTNYNFNAKNCILDGHTTYYEDKPATASTGGKIPDPVAMGSYDLIIEYSSHTYLTDVIQQDDGNTGLGDQRYWGIMSSNGTRNVFFTRVEVNRFDAHRGFWNATLIDTVLGHSFNVIGGGKLYCKNVTKITSDTFISLRGDYGAIFDGDMELIDCEHLSVKSYYSNKATPGYADYDNPNATAYIVKSGFSGSNSGAIIYKKDENGKDMVDAAGNKIIDRDGRYWYWDFGYTCYMPRNVILENYKSASKTVYVFPNLPNDIFSEEVTNQYQITQSVTFRNMDPIALTSNPSAYTRIANIKVIKE